jgi:hypothetical protein
VAAAAASSRDSTWLRSAGSGTAGPAAYGTLLAALPPERVGVGSAVNDTVQQVGQALSVAVLGSVLTAAFSTAMPDEITGPASRSIGDALGIAAATGDGGLAQVARDAFVQAMSVTSLVGVAGGLAAAVVALAVLRPAARPADGDTSEQRTADRQNEPEVSRS